MATRWGATGAAPGEPLTDVNVKSGSLTKGSSSPMSTVMHKCTKLLDECLVFDQNLSFIQ